MTESLFGVGNQFGSGNRIGSESFRSEIGPQPVIMHICLTSAKKAKIKQNPEDESSGFLQAGNGVPLRVPSSASGGLPFFFHPDFTVGSGM